MLYDINFAESLWLEVQIDTCTVVVGVIYRKPNTDINRFQESLLPMLEKIKVKARGLLRTYHRERSAGAHRKLMSS